MEKNQKKKMWIYSLIGMLTTIVILAFARLSYGVILPFMMDGLDITYKQAGYLGTTSSLGYLCMVMFAGILAAKWGGKKTILLGISLVSLGLIGLAFTPSYPITFIFMLLLGIGTSFSYTPLISLLVGWFPSHKGTVIGITTSGVGIGLLLTGMVVPSLESAFSDSGWRISWGLFAVVSVIAGLVTLFSIKNPPSHQSSTTTLHKKASAKEVYKNPRVIIVGFIYGIIGITYIIQVIFIMSYMIEAGLDTDTAGQLMALNGILSIFSGPIWGAISDVLGRKKSLNLTISITALAMVLPVISPTLLGFSLHTIIISCTITGMFTLIQASSMDHVKPSDMPIAFSYVTFYFAIGQFIGPSVAGWLIEDWGGFKSAFLFSTIFLVIGLLLSFKVKNSDKSSTPIVQVDVKIN